MDYQYIKTMAGAKVVRIIDEEYDDLTYKDLDPEELDDLIRGSVVLGSETIDYPATDGMILYLKRPAGDVVSVAFDADADPKGLIPLIVTRVATIQEGIT